VQASFANFVWGIPSEGAPLYPDLGISTRPREDKQLEIIDVEKDSPAARAGLKLQDVLVSFDGAAVPDRETLSRAMSGKRWGDAAAVVVRRAEANVPVPVLLRREPPAAAKP
jgi:serine protease Do